MTRCSKTKSLGTEADTRWRRLLLAAATCAVLLPFQAATAATTWAPPAGTLPPASTDWQIPGNWTAGVPNQSIASIFDSSSFTLVELGVPIVANGTTQGITFTGGANFTIGPGAKGGTLYVHGGGITVNGGNQTFTCDARPSAAGVFPVANHGSGLLAFNAGQMVNVSVWPTVTISGSGDIRVARYSRRHANQITNMDLVKNGSGTLTIVDGTSSAGAYNNVGYITGTTTINQGTISIDAEENLGGNPGGYFDAAGTWLPGSFNAAALTLNGGTLKATANFAIDDSNRGLTLGASGGTFEVDASRTLTIANAITGPGGLTKTGDGTLSLASANTFAGTTHVSAGTLALGHVSALQASTLDTGASGTQAVSFTAGTGTYNLGGLEGADDLAIGGNILSVGANNQSTNYSGVISGTGALTKMGSGTLTLSGANTYSGLTTIKAGTLRLAGGDNRINTTNDVTLQTGSTFDLNGQNQTIDSLDWSGGSVTLGSGTLTLGSANGMSDIRGSSVFTGTGGVKKIGTNTLYFGVQASYQGGTRIEQGRIWLYKDDNRLPMTGDVWIATGASLDLSHSNIAAGPRVQTIGGLGGSGTVTSSNRPTTFVVGNGGATSTFDGVIMNGSTTNTIALTKVGGGSLTLSGINTYTGPTTVNEGSLFVNGSITSNATVNGGLLGGNGTIGGTVTVNANGTVSAGNSTGHLRIAPATSAPNSYAQLALGTLWAEIGGFDQGATSGGYDWIEVIGGATLAPGAVIDVDVLSTFDAPVGSYFDILTATDGITGDASSLVLNLVGSPTRGLLASIVPLGGNMEALRLTAVPEPSTFALSALGLLGLAFLGRRRQR